MGSSRARERDGMKAKGGWVVIPCICSLDDGITFGSYIQYMSQNAVAEILTLEVSQGQTGCSTSMVVVGTR